MAKGKAKRVMNERMRRHNEVILRRNFQMKQEHERGMKEFEEFIKNNEQTEQAKVFLKEATDILRDSVKSSENTTDE